VTTTAPLSRDRILRCTLAVADRDGLEATSLRRVAAELGVHVTSLYHHVPTKEALLDGLVEELLASADLPLGDVGWEEWVRRFVDEVAQLASSHAGAFEVLMRRPVQGARASQTFETGLAAFQRAGLSPVDAYTAVKNVSLAVLGCCMERSTAVSGGELPQTDLAGLSPVDFPLIHQATSVADDADLVTALRELLVAGFAAQLRG
jgi:AcrR family transcriptional regulator